MRICLSELLAEKQLLLADGATGTNFMNMGLEPGFPPDLWNISAPEKPRALHDQFVDAGADIILTNTFGANAPRLKLHDAAEDTFAINKAGAQIAGQAAAASERPVVVAGSVGPTGELFAPMGELTPESAQAFFAEQIHGLKDGGADVIWIETMSAAEEIKAACLAAIEAGIPYVFTASFDTAGRTMMGIRPSEIGAVTDGLPVQPIAYGANCGVGASDMLLSNIGMAKTANGAVLVSKSNCGIPTIKGKETVYSGTPELMQDFTRMAANIGVRIIGGCCGTRPDHIAAMRKAIDQYKPAPAPCLEDITGIIGPLSSPPTEMRDLSGKAKRKRRRR